jgi:hypothetical protein
MWDEPSSIAEQTQYPDQIIVPEADDLVLKQPKNVGQLVSTISKEYQPCTNINGKKCMYSNHLK